MQVTLSAETIKSGIQALGLGDKANAAFRIFADRLRGDGVTAAAMTDSAEIKALILNSVILPSFSATDRAIYERPMSALSDPEKITKRYIASQARRKYGVVLKYVRTAEREETLDDAERAARAAVTFETRCRNEAEKRIALIQKRDDIAFNADKAVQYLRAYIEVINKG